MAQANPFDQFDDVEPFQPPQQAMGVGKASSVAPAPATTNVNAFDQFENVTPAVDQPYKLDFNRPTDPTGEGDIGFASQASAEANSLPAGAQEFQRDLQDLLGAGVFGDPGSIRRYARVRGFDISDEQAQAAFDAVQSGQGVSVATPTFRAPDISDVRGEGGIGESVDAAVRGIANIAGLDDEIGAIVDSVTRGGSLRENLARNRAIRDYDEDENFWARTAGTLGAGLLLPSGVANEARAAAVQALRSGLGREAAISAARRAAVTQLAKEGGAVGAAHGAGAADGNLGDRALGALVEAPLGAAAGAGIGAVGSRFLGPGAASAAERNAPSEGREVAEAAARQGIDVLPADVGGPTVRRLTGAAIQAPLSASPVINASQRASQQAEAARDRIAATIGAALNPEASGQAGVRGARSFIARTSAQARKLYNQATQAAGDARISPVKALEVLDRNIAELGEIPGGAAGLSRLQALRDELGKGDFSVRGLRNMRTALNDDFAEAGLRSSDIKRRVDQVVDAAADDIADGLTAQGRPDAARLFRTADRYWRNRIRTIDDVLEPIIGRDGDNSGEEVVKRVMADLRGNNARAVKFLNALPDEERATMRASVIGGLGRASKGQQNAENDAFSLSTFLTNWNDIGETAKVAWFGKEGRAALNDLAKVAEGTRNAQGYANKSNTAAGIWGNLGVLGGWFSADPATAITAGATQLIGGRLLASPNFARWLARAPKKPNVAAQRAHVAALSSIAKSEPAIAADVTELQRMLQRALTQSPAPRAAAQEDQDVRSEPPEQERQP